VARIIEQNRVAEFLAEWEVWQAVSVVKVMTNVFLNYNVIKIEHIKSKRSSKKLE